MGKSWNQAQEEVNKGKRRKKKGAWVSFDRWDRAVNGRGGSGRAPGPGHSGSGKRRGRKHSRRTPPEGGT